MERPRVRRSALLTIALTAVALATAVPVRAQLVSAGAASLSGASVDVNDIAYDEANSVYLHVFYQGGKIWGRFTNLGGSQVGGQFPVTPNLPFAGWPKIAYATGGTSGVFLVTFGTNVNRTVRPEAKNVYGQIVRFNNGGGELVGGAFPISPASTSPGILQDPGGIAYNSTTNKFLVTWTDLRGQWDAFARLFNPDGTPGGDEVNLSNTTNFQGAPSPAFDWRNNRFLVTWTGEASFSANVLGTFAKVVDGNTGAPITDLIVLSTGGFQDFPNTVYLPETGNYLSVWRDEQVKYQANVVGRLIDANGAVVSGIYPVIATGDFDGLPDSGYNWVTRTVMVSAMHGSGWVWGAELNAGGTPKYTFKASTMAPSPTGGSFNPNLAVGGGGQFGVSYALNLNSAWIDRWQGAAASEPGPHPGGGGEPPPPPPVTIIDLANAPNGSWFLAEGIANPNPAASFNSYYLLSNESQGSVEVRAYFAREDGKVTQKDFVIGGNARYTLDLAQEIGPGAYSAVFQSKTAGADIYVERSVFFGANFKGSTGAAAVKNLSPVWYFAEGSRGGELFENYFLLFNPLQSGTVVRGTFFRADGQVVVKDFVVPAQTRYTVAASQIPELAGADFSSTFSTHQTDGHSFVAERAMYWGKPIFTGGTASMGAPGLSQRWLFAEGVANSAFETFYLLLNPMDHPIVVTATYGTEYSGSFQRTYTVDPHQRYTVYLNGTEGGIGPTSVEFTSADWFMAERSIYWSNRIEGTNVIGAMAPARSWHLPEGSDGGQFDSYILIQNPSAETTTVDVTLFVQGYGRVTFPASVRPVLAPFSRMTLDMSFWLKQLEQLGEPAGSLVGKSFATHVRVVSGAPVVVEHALYWNFQPGVLWQSGAASLGIPD